MQPAPPPVPAFSRAKFDQVTLGDRVLQQQLLQSFLRRSPATRDLITQSAATGRAEFNDAVHHLKSTCHYAGGQRLLAYLLAVEANPRMNRKAARSAAAQDIVALLGELEHELSMVLGEFSA